MINSQDDQVNIDILTAAQIEKLKFDNFYNNQKNSYKQSSRKNNLTDMLVNMDEKKMSNR